MSKEEEAKPFKDMQQLTEVAWEKFKKKPFMSKKEEPKQETLEEAAKIHLNSGKIPNDYQSFIAGAKWQQEQIGNPEFLQRLRDTKSDAEARRLIFEQFKKK